jgi:hypothetical protein
MGWFSSNRRPFSQAFLDRLDRIEAAVESLVEPETAFEVPAPEVIPAKILSSRTVDGVEEFAWREVTKDPDDTGGRGSEGFDAAGSADPYAFPAKNAPESETFVVKHWIATSQDDGNGGTYPLHEVRYTVVGGAVIGGFEARVSTPVQIGSDARWEYDWKEVVWNPTTKRYDDLQDGRSSFSGSPKAINTYEAENTNTSAYGIAVSAGAGGVFYIHNTSQKYQFKPVPGTVVTMHIRSDANGDPIAVFSAPNPIDGNC